jgi:hypothetical protein
MKVLHNISSKKADDIIKHIVRHHVEAPTRIMADPNTIVIHLTEDEIKEIEARLATGTATGRKPKLTSKSIAEITRLYNARIRPSAIAAQFNISRQSVYNALEIHRKNEEPKK